MPHKSRWRGSPADSPASNTQALQCCANSAPAYRCGVLSIRHRLAIHQFGSENNRAGDYRAIDIQSDPMSNQNGLNVSFEQIIQQLMSPENQNRAQAEELFNQAKQQPDLLVAELMAVLRQSRALDARGLCAVLLRKV